MKKILMALIMTGLTYYSAEAQTKNCEVVQKQVCSKGRDCYKTQYAENFKVCKNDRGYFICCETPNNYNSTHPVFVVTNDQDGYMQINAAVPQSQSYENYNVINERTYEGYYPEKAGKGKIKSCYGGNNVAELNRAPYKGCPSPQYDGVDRNKERNITPFTPIDY